ncbi:MAG: MIP/aquaporin family protein [Thermodesulfobacteriota bacterium]
MMTILKKHWPEYLMEGAGLGFFMISACFFVALLEHPSSPFHKAIPDPMTRRALMGIAMGLTAITIIYSPWGKQSGAHINPSVTLTFFRLGKVRAVDAAFYIIAQFLGAAAGVLVAHLTIGKIASHPHVNYAATFPGMSGLILAFIAEVVISFILMTVVLVVSNTLSIARYTGIFAGILVAAYITFEAPISGMSMNPARSLGSSLFANSHMGIWIYFTAPIFGMLMAAEVYVRVRGMSAVSCAKLHHQNNKRCIHCGYPGEVKAENIRLVTEKAKILT